MTPMSASYCELGFRVHLQLLRKRSVPDADDEAISDHLLRHVVVVAVFGLYRSIGLSRKFWSGENFGPGDQNSRKIGPPGPLFPENLGPAVE